MKVTISVQCLAGKRGPMTTVGTYGRYSQIRTAQVALTRRGWGDIGSLRYEGVADDGTMMIAVIEDGPDTGRNFGLKPRQNLPRSHRPN